MSLYHAPIDRALDADGNPISGAKCYWYAAGGSTPKDTYTTKGGGTAHSNPVVADSQGYFPAIWLSGEYKLDKTDADDNSLPGYPVDNVDDTDADTIYPRSVLSAAGSAANAILADLPSTPGTWQDQQQFTVELQHGGNSDPAPTVDLNGMGPKTVVKGTDSPLLNGDTGGIGYKCQFNYSEDLDKVVLMNPRNADLGLGKWFRNGLLVTNNATDASHDIDIATGRVMDSTQAEVISLDSALTKQIDANWAAGNNEGGFPSGLTLSANTWYRVFLIKNPSTGAVEAGFDASATATNLINDAPTYTLYRRIAWVLTDSSSNILKYSVANDAKRYRWDVPVVHLAGTGNTSGANLTVQVPPSQVGIIQTQNYVVTAVTNYFYVSQTDQTNNAASSIYQTVRAQSSGSSDFQVNTNTIEILCDSSSQIRQRVNEAASFVYIHAIGFIDDIGVG